MGGGKSKVIGSVVSDLIEPKLAWVSNELD